MLDAILVCLRVTLWIGDATTLKISVTPSITNMEARGRNARRAVWLTVVTVSSIYGWCSNLIALYRRSFVVTLVEDRSRT